jgi:hypothetical protein
MGPINQPVPMITPCASSEMNSVAHKALELEVILYTVRSSSDPTCADWKEKHASLFLDPTAI